MTSLNRRDFVGALGAATLAASTLRAAEAPADTGATGATGPVGAVAPKGAPHDHGKMMAECLDNCRNCELVCLQTVQHCLAAGGEHAKGAHISLLLDCAQICHTSASFMVSSSEFSPKVCGVCSEVCDKCAQSCSKVPTDESMKLCIDACKRCVDSCKRMSKMK